MAPTDMIQEGEESSLSKQLEALRQNNQAELDKLRAEDEAKEPSTFTKIAQAVATIGIPALIGAAMGGKNGATLGAGQGGSAYGKYLTTKSKEDNAREESIRKARLESLKNTQKALQDTLLLPEKERIKAQAQADALELKMPMLGKLAAIQAGGRFNSELPPDLQDVFTRSLTEAGVSEDEADVIARSPGGMEEFIKQQSLRNRQKYLENSKTKLNRELGKDFLGPGYSTGDNAPILAASEAKEIRSQGADYDNVQAMLSELKTAVIKNGGLDMTKPGAGAIRQAQKRVFSELKKADKFGAALSGNEYSLLAGQISALPDSVDGAIEFFKQQGFHQNGVSSIDNLSRILEKGRQSRLLNSYGRALAGTVYDPKDPNVIAAGIRLDSSGRALPDDTRNVAIAGKTMRGEERTAPGPKTLSINDNSQAEIDSAMGNLKEGEIAYMTKRGKAGAILVKRVGNSLVPVK